MYKNKNNNSNWLNVQGGVGVYIRGYEDLGGGVEFPCCFTYILMKVKPLSLGC